MTSTPNLALPYILPSQAQKHVTHNEALDTLDALVQLSIADRDLSAPPASPGEGSRYIVAAGATGAWTGQSSKIAVWQGGGWTFVAPRTGWTAFIADENTIVVWNGTAWIAPALAAEQLQNLTRLGLGTTADATNPFAAKLNKALWSARTASEGGDGDLRYTLNKETASDTLSFLLQSGFSGRAEIGLIGDNDLVIKLSPDGSSWAEALRLDNTSGRVSFRGQLGFPAAQNASGDPNTLDDYEEGTTTPAVTADSGAFGSASASINYVKVGKWVFFLAVVTVTTVGTASGKVSVTLPFSPAVNVGCGGIETGVTGVGLAATSVGSDLNIYKYDFSSIIGAGRVLRVSGAYPAAA